MLNLLKNKKYDIYQAHKSDTEFETLYEHTDLVVKYFRNLIIKHNLEALINKLIKSLVNDKSFEIIKSIFFAIPEFHDIGKLNPNFQFVKMGNTKFKQKPFSFGSNHAKIGAFLLMHKFLPTLNDNKFSGIEKITNIIILFAFSHSIKKHHAPNIDFNYEYDFNEDFINDVYSFLNSKSFPLLPKEQQKNLKRIFNEQILPEYTKIKIKDNFALFALLKLNFSLLTASDYLATSHFMNNWGDELIADYGVLDYDLKNKIIKNIESSTHYNKKTYNELPNYQLVFPSKKSTENLNILRQNLSVEVINGIRDNLDRNLFYIEAPTGGGKTNLSMLAIAEFLRNDLNKNKITKIFYVFPFTTLITQTFSSLKKTLGLNDTEIVQIHSKAGFSQKESDDKYGKKSINIIDYQFVNYPISLLSHIKFFDILKSNRKVTNYLMHRLANSIVIIDELQSYSPKEWDKIIYFINKYAKYFNIKFILMSATLPKIDKLFSEDGKKVDFKRESFVFLNKNKDKYFQNVNFSDRLEFDFSLINNPELDNNNNDEYLHKLWEILKIESNNYKIHSKNNRIHTIIEFIFKNTASAFMEIANNSESIFDEVFILSGTTLEPRRKEIISNLKSPKYSSKNILLISTQVVEAGVDIDMDLGFKDTSLLDSDEQLAGRINRNVGKKNCKLFLFDFDDAKTIYGKDYRYKVIREKLSKDDYYNILQTKNFNLLYNLVMENILEDNRQEGYINLSDYIRSIKKLDFYSIDKDFQLISDSVKTTSIFVPIDIPIEVPNSKILNFNEKEIQFLKEKKKYNGEPFVNGEKIWELYCEIIENKDPDFTKQKIEQTIMQGLVSKFSFSIGTYSKNMKNIESSGFGEEKFGFYKINDVEKVYDYKNGIKQLTFEDINFL